MTREGATHRRRGEVTGIVTERDYLRRVALEERAEEETAVRAIVSHPLIVATLVKFVESKRQSFELKYPSEHIVAH